jgi:hypothetical protein
MLTPYEAVVILRSNLTPAAIAAMGGPVEEVQRRILKKPDYNVRNLHGLIMLLERQKLLPFDKFWIQPVMRLYQLEQKSDVATMEHEQGALFNMAQLVIEANLTAVAPSVRKGALFFAAKYLSNFTKAKQAVYAKSKPEALKRASKYYEALIEELRDDHDPCSVLIKGVASANIVVNRWNATPHAQRTSKEMRDFIRRSGYLTWASEQIRIWPRVDRPAFNLLGIASRFRRRGYYPDLLEALRKANSKFEKYPEYADSDFDDFRNWLTKNG